MARTHPAPPPWLPIMVALYFSTWGATTVLAAHRNVTIDDIHSLINYSPVSAWHDVADVCSSCLHVDPSLASNGTFHQGVNANSLGGGAAARFFLEDSPPNPPPSDIEVDTEDEDNVLGTEGDPRPKGRRHQETRSLAYSRWRLAQSLASRDAFFDDDPVTLQFNFTGIAIYVYGIQPAGLSPSTDTSTNTNLTFSLDGQVTRQIANNAPPSTSAALSFTPNALLYHNAGLTDTTHSLTVTVGSDSIFLFDYLIFTSTSDSVNQLSPTFPYNLILAQTSEVTQKAGKSNVVTFAAAIGGSVGLLSIIALGLAISIMRRRALAARRDRHDSSSLHTDASEDTPHMSGPAPFVPRFFPGTQLPADPPPYYNESDSIRSFGSDDNQRMHGLSGPYRGRTTHPRDRSYADIPPSTPPPPLDDAVLPPPPFGVAIITRPSPTHPIPPASSSPYALRHPSILSAAPPQPPSPAPILPPGIVGDSQTDLRQLPTNSTAAVTTTATTARTMPADMITPISPSGIESPIPMRTALPLSLSTTSDLSHPPSSSPSSRPLQNSAGGRGNDERIS